MAKHRYLPAGVLFDDDINDTDEYVSKGFRSRIPRPVPKETSNNVSSKQNQFYEKRKQELETSILKSTERSINILMETEDIGIKAAIELSSQGEKLHKANTTLDVIDSHLNQSKKDINGIKSIFHGFKNIVLGKSRSPSPARRQVSHKKDSKSMNKLYTPNDPIPKPTKLGVSYTSSNTLHTDIQSSAKPLSTQELDKNLQANLDTISHHISELKILGVEFGKEIDQQNELIDILDDKVERVNIKIGKQNKDMREILEN